MPEPEGQINSQPYPVAVNEQGQVLWHTVRVAEERDEVWDDWSLGAGETERQTGRGYYIADGFDASQQNVLHLSPHYKADNNTLLTTGYGYFCEETGVAAATLTEQGNEDSTADINEGAEFSDSDTTLTVSDGSVFTAEQCITIEAEVLYVSAVDSNDLTVERGYQGTTAVAHADGTDIYHSRNSTGISTGSASETFVQRVTAGNTNRLLLVSITSSNTAAWDSSVTYGGLPMSVLGFIPGTSIKVAFYYLLDPPTGSNTVQITVNTAMSMVFGASAWYGVNQDTPFGTAVAATGTSDSPALTVTTGAGEWIFYVVGADDAPTVTPGTNETERWDLQQGSVFTGYVGLQDGDDGSAIAPTLSASENWAAVGVSIKPASTTSQSYVFIGDADYVWRYTYDSAGGPVKSAAGSGSQQVSSGVAGQPAKMNGYWYMPFASGATAQKLTNPAHASAPWVNTTGTWKADHLCSYQQGVNPTIARVNSTNQNTVELNVDTGDVEDNWTQASTKVGNTTAKCTGLAETYGLLFIGTEIALYDYGLEGETRPITKFLSQGKIDPDNGRYTMAFGDMVVYLCTEGLLRYRIGGGVLPMGIDEIDGFRGLGVLRLGLITPISGRHAFAVPAGKYWYVGVNKGQDTWLLQMSPRAAGDEQERTIHTVLKVPLSKGAFVDSNMNLWLKGASIAEDDRDIRVIQLNPNGSIKASRRGQASATHRIILDERNPGRPQDQVQLRHFTVELSGSGWQSTNCYLQRGVFRNSGLLSEDVGDTVGSSGVDTANWTVGTKDTCYRFRPQLSVTTSSSYDPKLGLISDPWILRVIVGIRFPEIIRIVVPADDALLKNYGMTAIDAEQKLRRLQNQGVVAFLRPDQLTTFNAEVTGVTDVMYQNSEGNYCHGLELMVQRWITS